MESLVVFVVLVLLLLTSCAADADETVVPFIDGDWWRIASNPDMDELTRPTQQPVDFAVWRAADGTWQLLSCIRSGDADNTRVFYQWEGKSLTDTDWRPVGVTMRQAAELGETHGGLQAPHVIKQDGVYHMAYGDMANICFATSTDGKTFERHVLPDGGTGIFTEGPGANTRDPMLLFTKGEWYCYYTACLKASGAESRCRQGYVFCRRSPDLRTWDDSCVVAYGGSAGKGACSAECPHVVEPQPGAYYLFRTQAYGPNNQTSVYRSSNPLNFGIDDDRYLLRTLPVAAPEIIHYEGQYYIASLLPTLDGIRMAKLAWGRLNT